MTKTVAEYAAEVDELISEGENDTEEQHARIDRLVGEAVLAAFGPSGWSYVKHARRLLEATEHWVRWYA